MDEKILKALCEPKRFLLLQLMSHRGYCVRALARKSQLSESAVSQHLKILREAGLVYGVKRGYYTHYGLDKEVLGSVISELETIRDAERRPCHGPHHGCEESEYLRCKSYKTAEKKPVRFQHPKAKAFIEHMPGICTSYFGTFPCTAGKKRKGRIISC